MSNSSQEPWSNNPYAPQIPYRLYLEEKAMFAGTLIGTVLYGIVVVLFFQCMWALVGPINRTRGGIKWGLVAHTTAMFSVLTIYNAIILNNTSISYIDNREFPGVDGMLPPGPLGYQYLTYSDPVNTVAILMFLLNNWLADGLLLYRCYVIYSNNYLVIAFPCLMYLASFATGITLIIRVSRPVNIIRVSTAIKQFGIPHHSISVSLNILLTTMIAARLMLHNKAIRKAMGTSATTSGLYKAVVTMLVESCAFYAVTFVLFIGPWAVGSHLAGIFFPILVQVQVIAPFLVIFRVANRNALTSETIVSGTDGSIDFRTQRKPTAGAGTLPSRYPTSSVDTYGETPGGLGVGVAITIDLHPAKEV